MSRPLRMANWQCMHPRNHPTQRSCHQPWPCIDLSFEVQVNPAEGIITCRFRPPVKKLPTTPPQLALVSTCCTPQSRSASSRVRLSCDANGHRCRYGYQFATLAVRKRQPRVLHPTQLSQSPEVAQQRAQQVQLAPGMDSHLQGNASTVVAHSAAVPPPLSPRRPTSTPGCH